MKNDTVYLIGAGCVNLITAYYLRRNGYEVAIIDAKPSPFKSKWNELGCTWGGEDARMFTITEADNYNQKSVPITDESNYYFSQPVEKLGWDIRQEAPSQLEDKWVSHHRTILPEQAVEHEKSILSFNIESKSLWETMQAVDAELFENVGYKEGIIRLYSDEASYLSQVARHERLNSLLHRYDSVEELVEDELGLEGVLQNKLVAGGFKTVGFTVNVHKFFTKLINWLEKHDVSFHWDEKVEHINRDAQGNVVALETTKRTLEGTNFVLSLGAYGTELLQQTPAKGMIGGVLGAWLTLPNLYPNLKHSMKLARKGHITEDANITLATDKNADPILIIGSGYGFTGFSPDNINSNQLSLIYQGIQDTAKNYFPEAYEQALQNGHIEDSQKYCVRPWTATGLGVFEATPTATRGQCIITGGHNTGGFAQAPAIAQAVIASLKNDSHTMHRLYSDLAWQA